LGAALGQLEDTSAIRRLQAHIRIVTAQVEERGPGYSRSVASSYSRSRAKHLHQQRRGNGPLELVVEEGRGENEVIQPVNPAANTAANNPPANATTNAAGNNVNNTANAAGAQPNIAANPRQNAGPQPLPAQANHAEGSQPRCIREEVEIARRANYDRDHGVPGHLKANNPIQATKLRQMHDQELL
jgi:hypothetical protein